MIESKFAFIGKIFLILFFILNLPIFLPLDLFNVSYLILVTTTIFDTTSLLIISLSISKFVHKKNLDNLIKIQDKDDKKISDKINLYKNQVNNDNKLSFILVISFAFITLIQPIILIVDINKSDIYSSAVINSLNSEYNNEKKIIEELILKEKKQDNNKNELNKLNMRRANLTKIKDRRIDQLVNNSNNNKFKNVKIIIRNILLGAIFIFCFCKIYNI